MSLLKIVRWPFSPHKTLASLYDGVTLEKRGPAEHDCLEAFIDDEDVQQRLDALAAEYAAEVLGAQALPASRLLLTEYHQFHWCDMHQDQYDREGAGSTLNRTVSASLIVKQAYVGGDMLFQRPDRKGYTIAKTLKAGDVVLFPADWWHEVTPINTGRRRSIVRWYNDPDLETFSSL